MSKFDKKCADFDLFDLFLHTHRNQKHRVVFLSHLVISFHAAQASILRFCCAKALTHALIALAFCAVPVSAVASAYNDLIVSRAYAVDKSGTWTIEQATKKPYTDWGQGTLSRGYTRSVTWVRLEVAASLQQELVVEIRPAYHDDVRLFSPVEVEGVKSKAYWQEQRTGDQVPFAERPRDEITLSFSITPSPINSTTHYLRIDTHNASLFSVDVTTEAQARASDTLLHLLMGLYVGVFVVMIWQALLRAMASSDALWSALIVYLIATIIHGVVNMGFVAKYLSAYSGPALDFINNLNSCTHLALTMVLVFVMLKNYSAPKLLLWPYAIYLVVYPLQLWLLVHDRAWQALQINSTMVMLSAIWGFFAIWFVPFDDWLQGLLMRVFNSTVALFALMMIALPLLGWSTGSKFSLYPAMATYLATALLIFSTLIRRDFLNQRTIDQIQKHEHELAFALAAEQRQRQESASFMSMLLHELKTPLAAIRLAAMSIASGRVTDEASRQKRLAAIDQSVDDINLVLERTREVDRFEQGMVQARRAVTDVVGMIDQMAFLQSEAHRLQVDSPDMLWVELDPTLTNLMVRNLVENALRYSPTNSPVTLAIKLEQQQPTGDRAMLHITVGNALSDRTRPDPDRLFTKYYRADSSHDRTGVGLGLYWVRGVARQLGGDVLHRLADDTIEFELQLPCTPEKHPGTQSLNK